MDFLPLPLAALLWVGVHIGLAGTPLRGVIAGAIGEPGFRISFSLLSVLSIMLLVGAYNTTPTSLLWATPDALKWVLALLMLPAFILFVGSVAGRNATAVGSEAMPPAEPRGIARITRHPMLVSFALWGVVHILGNGDSTALWFFGAFLVTSVAGMPSIDAKLAARNPAGWAPLAASTSIMPFGAILAGRNRLVLSELWLPIGLGTVAWAAMLHFHRGLIGVPPLPMG